jgi:hypothetical protein
MTTMGDILSSAIQRETKDQTKLAHSVLPRSLSVESLSRVDWGGFHTLFLKHYEK